MSLILNNSGITNIQTYFIFARPWWSKSATDNKSDKIKNVKKIIYIIKTSIKRYKLIIYKEIILDPIKFR